MMKTTAKVEHFARGKILLAITLASVAFVDRSYSETLYNVNFGGGIGGSYLPNYSGLGAAPDSAGNTFWNQTQATENGIGNYSVSLNNLVASDGATPSGINVSIDYSRAYNDTGISGNNLLGSWFQVDGSVNGSGVGVATISGLAAGSYDLYLYGINGGFTGRGTRFLFNLNYWTGGTVDPGNSSFHYLETTGTSASSFQEGPNYVHFSGVESFNGSIQFYIGANPAGGNDQGPFNGFQLVDVAMIPEPSTGAFLGAGFLVFGFMLMRRRKAGAPGAV